VNANGRFPALARPPCNEPGLKAEVEAILAELRLTASWTVNLLCRQIKLQCGLPFGTVFSKPVREVIRWYNYILDKGFGPDYSLAMLKIGGIQPRIPCGAHYLM
jgi:hypothetical protein